MEFIINPYYLKESSELSLDDIRSAIETSKELISQNIGNKIDPKKFELIGVGNDANGKVYSILNSRFCLKIASFGKHVGKDQTKQFF